MRALKECTRVIQIDVNMFFSLGVAVLALILGHGIKTHSHLLRRFCIPSPIVGGLVIAVVCFALYAADVVEFSFNTDLQSFFMMVFFTTVGFQADFKHLKAGGKQFFILVALVALLIVVQNLVAIGLSMGFGLDPLMGLCMGSIPMVGGFGTAGAFGPELENLGIEGALTTCIAAATFGMVAGSLIGGPVANHLIVKNSLMEATGEQAEIDDFDADKPMSGEKYTLAFFLVMIAISLGEFISWGISETGLIFPGYIGSMIVAAVMRNLLDRRPGREVPMTEVGNISNISLTIFLGFAMIGLKIWQLADLALPMVVILLVQTIVMFLFAYFLCFRTMGRDYDAAVMSGGMCGFGMGAVTNAMANMQAITSKYVPSQKAFLLIPLAGVMFADLINSMVLVFFMNVL